MFAAVVALTFGTAALFAEQDGQKPRNEFVFQLYRSIVQEKSEENVAVSPYCAQLLLDLVRSGAAGETKAEIDRLLATTESVKWTAASPGSPLTTAAALWTQQGHSFLPAFLNTARRNFGASVEQADFAGNPDAAVQRINAWCAEKTKEKITVLFEELAPTTRCVLAGAIHFAADWEEPFDAEATSDAPFTLLDGTEVETRMMYRDERLKYGETDDTLILELPYKNDGYAMLLLLPKNATDFAKWEAGITSAKWNALRAAMKREDVEMCMPRFTVECDLPLNETLKQLGMPTAFTGDADFSKMTGTKGLLLNEVRQKTFVKVDETGTEAAAVTVAVMELMAMPDMDKNVKQFFADRPFLYAIVKGDTVLFLGRFIRPE